MTVEDAAKELGLTTPDYLYRIVRMGKIRATKVGRRWDISPEAVADYKRRVEHKRSSLSNRAEQRAQRVAEVQRGFVSVA